MLLDAEPEQLPACTAPALAFLAGQSDLQYFSAPRRDSSYLLQGNGRISNFGSLGLPSSCVPDQSSLLFPETGGRPAR